MKKVYIHAYTEREREREGQREFWDDARFVAYYDIPVTLIP